MQIKRLITTYIFFICNILIALSQQINFERYNIEKGLIHPSIYTINQDKSGFIWIGTGAGLCRFDGTKFTKPSSNDTITDAYVSCSFRSSEGTLWIGYDDGSIYSIEKLKLKKIYR